MDPIQIWEQVKEYAPAYSIIAAIIVCHASRSIHRWDERNGDRLKHDRTWVPGVLSMLSTCAMALAGFFPCEEILWQLIVVWGGSSIFYNIFLKKKKEKNENG